MPCCETRLSVNVVVMQLGRPSLPAGRCLYRLDLVHLVDPSTSSATMWVEWRRLPSGATALRAMEPRASLSRRLAGALTQVQYSLQDSRLKIVG